MRGASMNVTCPSPLSEPVVELDGELLAELSMVTSASEGIALFMS